MQIPYDYLVDPIVSSVFPTGGPTSGGTLLTIRGSGFSSAALEDAYVEQWASFASSRSEYTSGAGAAVQALGKPNA